MEYILCVLPINRQLHITQNLKTVEIYFKRDIMHILRISMNNFENMESVFMKIFRNILTLFLKNKIFKKI